MLKIGSTAFITCVIRCSRHSADTDSALDASTCAATYRSSVAAAFSARAGS